MSFEFRRAERHGIPLIIGVAGPTGGGKTMSALRLARGLADGKPFAVIDTEAGRALHYADNFEFDHGSLDAPFRPERYTEAIRAADDAGYPVIVVDSMSHEHAGDGGLLDWHEQILQDRAGDDWRRRDALTMAAWIEPKLAHKRMVSKLLQVRAHLILCFRAEAKVEIARENGKTVIRPKQSLTGSDDGWIPVAEKSLPYELTASLLVTPDAPGVPKPIKLNEAHRALIALNEPLSEATGGALGAWAQGIKIDTAASIEELTERLLGIADKLGSREIVETAVEKSKAQRGEETPAHEKWLRAQIANAEAKAVVDSAQSELSVPQEGAAA